MLREHGHAAIENFHLAIMGENILFAEFQQMRAPVVRNIRFPDSIIDCRRPGQLFFKFRFDSIIITTLTAMVMSD